LFITSSGYESGPKNNPRVWNTARWTGDRWEISQAMVSDSNYDMGSLYIENGVWRLIAPTKKGSQAYNPGGEIAMWISRDQGHTWNKVKQLTSEAPVTIPMYDCQLLVPRSSTSSIYMCDQQDNVRVFANSITLGKDWILDKDWILAKTLFELVRLLREDQLMNVTLSRYPNSSSKSRYCLTASITSRSAGIIDMTLISTHRLEWSTVHPRL